MKTTVISKFFSDIEKAMKGHWTKDTRLDCESCILRDQREIMVRKGFQYQCIEIEIFTNFERNDFVMVLKSTFNGSNRQFPGIFRKVLRREIFRISAAKTWTRKEIFERVC